MSHSRVSNQSLLAVEIFYWGCRYLGSLVPGEGAAEVMGKFLFLLVTVTAWLSVSGLPPPSLTLSLWFPTTRLCPSLGWNPSFSLALWSRHASCLLGVQSSPRVSISSSYPSGSAHSSVCTSLLHILSSGTLPVPGLPSLPGSGARLPGILPFHVQAEPMLTSVCLSQWCVRHLCWHC